ncbi:MAG: hypothetical protein DRQ49_01070 [Gammaproteobacteria bacterium]|nr:MAG: hypothetical protein DRQ49_01070 [Gammaproteobacteria bacterium]RKZ45132.1 MAG: hypothetical protein DRQ41_01010 [Gammaproteobacteria bacterium]RKZ75537.1 MAG: hypothetical protein DRQ57_07145 [Gammaproteobacteria bacterium]
MLIENQQPPLILIVDDDIFVRGMLEKLIKKQGYRVTTAINGANALEEFQRCHPNLILMDAVMPVMDGFKACAELNKLSSVPIIMVTSLDDEQSVNKAFEAGAVEYITKPIHWAVLHHRLAVILETRSTQAALRKSEARFLGIFEQAAIGIALVNMDGQLIDSNPATQKMLGLDEVNLQGKLFNQFFHPIDLTKKFYQELLDGTRHYYQIEKYFFRKKNAPISWARLTISLVRKTNSTLPFFVYMIEDITQHKRDQTSLRIAVKVFETTTNSVIITNAEGNIIDINQAFLLTTGYSYEEVFNKNPRFLKSGRHDQAFYKTMWKTVLETGYWNGEIHNRYKNGEIYSAWMSLNMVQDEDNKTNHYVAIYSELKG